MKFLIFLVVTTYIVLLAFNDKNNLLFVSKEVALKSKNYDCSYSKLVCSFRSANKFYAGCYPVFHQVLYNRTDCPRLKDSFLTGFAHH